MVLGEASSALGSSFAHTPDPSFSRDSGPVDDGLTFSAEDGTPGLQRHAQHSVDPRSSQRPNKQDQHILSEKHLYDRISEPSTGNFGFHDGWNDFLLPNDPNGAPAELDLGLGNDVFGTAEPGFLELGLADRPGTFGFEEYVHPGEALAI